MRRTALAYLRRGWSVIPMKMSAKHPAVRWKGYQTRIAHENTIRRWFPDDTEAGVAVVFGAVSGGLGSRDFDDMSSYEHWASVHPDLARCLPTVATSRGRHVYFHVDETTMLDIRNTVGKPGTGAIYLSDGELRAGVGCYSVLPPSRHPSGALYKWLIPLPVGPLPTVNPMTAGMLFTIDVTERNREAQRTTEAIGARVVVEEVVGCEHSDAIEHAIFSSLPSGPGRRNEMVFNLVRSLKSVPAHATAEPRELKPYVQRWHQLARPMIRTKPFEETWIDFLRAWPKVKFPKGAEPMVEIMERVRVADLPSESLQFEQEKLRLLVAICRELQRSAGTQPFFLSCRTAGQLLGVNHKQAWRWLFLLVEEGLLYVVRKGQQGSGPATRFRYLAELSSSKTPILTRGGTNGVR
ncbi:MAG: bifunctional DNA primase/polymerase [Pirellulaceae bacterium]